MVWSRGCDTPVLAGVSSSGKLLLIKSVKFNIFSLLPCRFCNGDAALRDWSIMPCVVVPCFVVPCFVVLYVMVLFIVRGQRRLRAKRQTGTTAIWNNRLGGDRNYVS